MSERTPAPKPLPSQPAERDDRRAEVEAETRAERHAEYLDTMADVIMDSGAAGKLEAKSVMMKAAKFIREIASTIDPLTAERDRLQQERDMFRDALANVMGFYDTPLSRRRFPPDDFAQEALLIARQALKGEHA